MTQSMMILEKSSPCLSWYDLTTGTRQGRLDLPVSPQEFVVDAENRYAYATHHGERNSGIEGTQGRAVLVVDLRRRSVAHVYGTGKHARPHGIALDAAGRLYVLSEYSGHLLVKENPRAFDQGWDHATPTGGRKCQFLALTRDGRTAYSTNLDSGDVTVFDPYDATVAPVAIRTGERPEGRCLREDAGLLYTSQRGSNTVAVVDTATRRVLRSFPTPDDPCRVYYDARRNRLITMNRHGRSFSVFDEASGEMLREQATPADPLALCIDAKAGFAYIAVDCEQVQRVSLDSFEVVQTFATGKEPDVMHILPDGFAAHWETKND